MARAHSIDHAPRSCNFGSGYLESLHVIVPCTWLSGAALCQGDTVQRDVQGLCYPTFRLSVNLFGAPALPLTEFKAYEQDVIIGVRL